jgi:type VI secretion system protein ImpG
MQAKHYLDELAWLREMGAELARTRPELSRYLGEAGADPDVERLFEGFAFLTGRIREKLDDEFPELTHGVLEMLCPHYLRPVPALALVQVRAKPNMVAPGLTLPRGALLESVPVDGTRCRFRTVADLAPAPVELVGLEVTTGRPRSLRLKLRPVSGLALPADAPPRPLRLFCTGDGPVARALHVALCRQVQRILVRLGDGKPPLAVAAQVQPGGLADAEAALPLPDGSFRGFRLLQEYFAFPERFLCVDVHGVAAASGTQGEFELIFELREAAAELPPVSAANLVLDIVPAVNLFAHDADPIRFQPGRFEYRIRPAGVDPRHYDAHSVAKVVGRVRGSAAVQEYEPFFAFGPKDRAAGRFYRLRRRDAPSGAGSDLFLRLGAEDPLAWADVDTVSLDLWCTNRDLPLRLGPGDIARPAADTSTAFSFRNLGAPTPPVPPPLGDEVYWRLLAHLSLDLQRLATVTNLRTALALYDFRARGDRQARRRLDNLLEAISAVDTARAVVLHDGLPIAGVDVRLALDETKCGGDGEAHLFGTVLAEFLAQGVALNSFVRLAIDCTGDRERFLWPARLGRKIVL